MKREVAQLNLFRSAIYITRTFKEALLDLGIKNLPMCLFWGGEESASMLHGQGWMHCSHKKIIFGPSESPNCSINGETTPLPAPLKAPDTVFFVRCCCQSIEQLLKIPNRSRSSHAKAQKSVWI